MTFHRFTVMGVLTALLVGLAGLPELAIVKVSAFGLGIEHEQGWRRKSSLGAAAGAAVASLVSRVGSILTGWQAGPFFRPGLGLAALALAAWSPETAVGVAMIGALTEGTHAGEFLAGERPDGGSRGNRTLLSGQDLAAGAVLGRVRLGIGRVSIPVVAGGTGTGTVSAVFAGPDVEVGNYVLQCTEAVAHGGVFSLTTPSGKLLPALTMTPGSGGSTVYTSSHINFTITDATDFITANSFTFVVSTTVPTVIGGTGTGVLSALTLGPDAKPGNYRVINNVVAAGGGDMSVIGPDGSSVGGRFIWAASGSTATFTSSQISFTISDATDYIAGNYFDICVFNNLSGGKVVAWDPTVFDGRHRVDSILFAAIDASAADHAAAVVCRDAVVYKDALSWAAARTSAQKETAYKEMAALGIVAK